MPQKLEVGIRMHQYEVLYSGVPRMSACSIFQMVQNKAFTFQHCARMLLVVSLLCFV